MLLISQDIEGLFLSLHFIYAANVLVTFDSIHIAMLLVACIELVDSTSP